MPILLTALARSACSKWQVRLDQNAFTFRSEAEARAFADTLQTRIQAPHRFPESQQRSAG